MDSILTSIKKLLGLTEADTSFDTDIVIQINSALATLTQIGVGPEAGFSIVDKTTVWASFIPNSPKLLGLVKAYVYIKVKLVFDPSASSVMTTALTEEANELEWRISTSVDPEPTNTGNGGE